MKAPFLSFDAQSLIKELGDFNTKFIKGVGALTEIDEIDVGTAPKELIYAEDKLKLYRYSRNDPNTCRTPVLIVYALVNRQYMLDLQPDRSMIRNMLDHGLDVFIIDWGYPSKVDMYLGLDDYVNGYIDNCVDVVRDIAQSEQVNLMGICQGGTFSMMYSALNPDKVKNLITLVAPVDFSTNDALLFNWSKYLNIDALVESYQVIPGDFMNGGFLMLMPFNLNIRKYVDMLDVIEDKEKLLNFLRMEKWIFDSPGQAGACIREFIKYCYQENRLAKGELMLGDKLVDLRNITMPLLNIYASGDHLVPPAAIKPLNDLVGSQDKTLYEFKGGHIGVFVGSKSQKELAPAISQWLHDRDGAPQSAAETAEESESAGIETTPEEAPESTSKKPGRRKA